MSRGVEAGRARHKGFAETNGGCTRAGRKLFKCFGQRASEEEEGKQTGGTGMAAPRLTNIVHAGKNEAGGNKMERREKRRRGPSSR